MKERYRVGRRCPWNIYRINPANEDRDHDDRFAVAIGPDAPTDGPVIVAALNSDAEATQQHNTVCKLAVELRNDIKALVSAALGSWDDAGDSVEQVWRALERIREANRFTPPGAHDDVQALAIARQAVDLCADLLGRYRNHYPASGRMRTDYESNDRLDGWGQRVLAWQNQLGDQPPSPGPRVWKKGDPEPSDRPLIVRDYQGDEWAKVREGWLLILANGEVPDPQTNRVGPHPWSFVASFAPLTEVIQDGSNPAPADPPLIPQLRPSATGMVSVPGPVAEITLGSNPDGEADG